MIWLKDLYVSPEIDDKKDEIIDKINNGKKSFVFLITLSRNESDMLEIFRANILTGKYYKSQNIIVIGIAKSKKKAYELVKQIVDDCYIKTSSYNVKAFIKSSIMNN